MEFTAAGEEDMVGAAAEAINERAERKHFETVCRTLLMYSEFAELSISRKQDHLNKLSPAMARMLPTSTWSQIPQHYEAIAENQELFSAIVEFQDYNFTDRDPHAPLEFKYSTESIPAAQMHRNQAILHSLAREWSVEGRRERDICFAPLISELKKMLPVTDDNLYRQKVLVPGAGLCRLAVEIAAEGYATQANEYSMFMLAASHFILNGVCEERAFQTFPWLDRVCNVVKPSDPLSCVLVPDRPACDILEDIEKTFSFDRAALQQTLPFPIFSMAAGDFVETYGAASQAGQWDAIVTCFFIDTAPVVMEYIDVISRMLRPGGVWVNIGPLLYHWANGSEGNDERYDQSIELSWEEVRHVIAGVGFEFTQEQWVDCDYTRHAASMMWTTYRAIHFTARKPLEAAGK